MRIFRETNMTEKKTTKKALMGKPVSTDDMYPEELTLINDKKTQLTYLRGENLFKQGAFAPNVLYIIDGLVKIFLQTGYEKQINISLAKAGDFLAFSSVFGENVYNYSAIALKDSRICMIDKEGLKQLLKSNPDFAIRVTARSLKNERHVYEIIKNISYKQMRGKLASALLYLSDDDWAGEDVFQYLTRQDIADFAVVAVAGVLDAPGQVEQQPKKHREGQDESSGFVHEL